MYKIVIVINAVCIMHVLHIIDTPGVEGFECYNTHKPYGGGLE